MNIIKYKKIFLSISALLVASAIAVLVVFGLNPGIDFKGGTLMEVEYMTERPSNDFIQNSLTDLELGIVVLQPTGEKGLILKMNIIDEVMRGTILDTLGGNIEGEDNVSLKTFTSIGPSVGDELRKKAILAIVVVIIAIVFFIAYVFRHVSEPVSSWKYGFVAIIALIHDVLITSGVFVFFTKFMGAQADTLFIVALLTVLGLSINDTIVVFDRVRENLLKNKEEDTKEAFSQTVGTSLSQTLVRSFNTSLSTLFVLGALVLWGPESTKIFALTLAVGIFIGTYSSIFLASPLLVLWNKKEKN
ncbi:MAG: preprotein translocase subunit SecF [Flavobacteriaceae bacterium]|jgi:preprotein translocase subunit SecF